ncbi:hypothetical protein P280DRAFT_67029 [Massarina eburnea CBS 473.64]|uniref:Secreted protein n=1 Tax=Massarina eburnea CBS 473.64 TaxID=1395130 RepID=A0A6A6RTT1_9PLEO|nr:hypothetical protein P280DRAFT_67029 [Massarina eburnea CBS 473.64]
MRVLVHLLILFFSAHGGDGRQLRLSWAVWITQRGRHLLDRYVKDCDNRHVGRSRQKCRQRRRFALAPGLACYFFRAPPSMISRFPLSSFAFLSLVRVVQCGLYVHYYMRLTFAWCGA